MSHKELPITFQEITEEEKAANMTRWAFQKNRMVRCSPGDFILPYKYTSFADKFYNFEFRDDDVVVLTFPKSGTVWSADILWAMTHFDQIHTMDTTHISSRNFFLDRDFLLPVNSKVQSPVMKAFQEKFPEGDMEEGMMLQLAKAEKGRRIIKSHLPPQFFNPNMLSKTRVVYVARNPKDVSVSRYFMVTSRSDMVVEGDFSDFAEGFMEGNCHYAPYWTHILQAWKLRDHPNFHIVFYEDMKNDIIQELRKLNEFLKLDLTDDQLKIVAEATNFENMKKRDLESPLIKEMTISFFRKGVIGDWKNMATAEMDAKMDRWIEENSKNTGIKFKYS